MSEDVENLRSALAELENAKSRVQRELDRRLELEKADLLDSLLPVLDNLERSIAAGAGQPGPLLDGVKLVHSQFLDKLTRFGLQRHSAVGKPFDPQWMDAMAVVPVNEPIKDGIVLAESEPAYFHGERVIRPAKVQVARAALRPPS